jgi:hypothetical protein
VWPDAHAPIGIWQAVQRYYEAMQAIPTAEFGKVPCIASDPRCPCNDGDTCNYVATKKTPAFEVPHPDAAQLISIADLMSELSGADPTMLANVGHYLRGLSDRVKVLPAARTGPLRVAAEAVSAPVEARKDAGWQPIETAPRAFVPPLSPINHHAPDILGLWGESFYCICSWGGPSQPFWIDGDNKQVTFQPTRWRPLPAAAEPSPAQMTDVQQISMALQPFGLSILKTATGYKVEKLGLITAQIAPVPRDMAGMLRADLSATTPPQAGKTENEIDRLETEVARLTAELAQANAMCESLAASVQDLANAKAAVDEAHAIELADEKAVVDVLRSELQDRLQKQRAAEAELREVRKDAMRLDWLLPNLHPATWGMEFPGGYEWDSPAELLAKWRTAIDAELAAAPKAPKP